VNPYLAYIGHVRLEDIAFNREEVDSVFAMSIDALIQERKLVKFRGTNIDTSEWDVPGKSDLKIWGLTAMFLHHALDKALIDTRNKL